MLLQFLSLASILLKLLRFLLENVVCVFNFLGQNGQLIFIVLVTRADLNQSLLEFVDLLPVLLSFSMLLVNHHPHFLDLIFVLQALLVRGLHEYTHIMLPLTFQLSSELLQLLDPLVFALL